MCVCARDRVLCAWQRVSQACTHLVHSGQRQSQASASACFLKFVALPKCRAQQFSQKVWSQVGLRHAKKAVRFGACSQKWQFLFLYDSCASSDSFCRRLLDCRAEGRGLRLSRGREPAQPIITHQRAIILESRLLLPTYLWTRRSFCSRST